MSGFDLDLFVLIDPLVTNSFILFSYEFTTDVNSRNSKRSKSLLKELVLGFIASVFLGIGSLFVFLSAGLYV